MKTLKRWTTNIILGLISSAIFAFLVAPEQQVELGSLALGLLAVPLVLMLLSAAFGFYALYLLIHLIEVIAVKLHLLDISDVGS